VIELTEKKGREILVGAYIDYKDNTFLRNKGKNAPDILTIEQETGERDISVWGKSKGAEIKKPSELKSIKIGDTIAVPIYTAEYKGQVKYNLDVFDKISLADVPKQKKLVDSADEPEQKYSDKDTSIIRQTSAKVAGQICTINASVEQAPVTQDSFEKVASWIESWIRR
jgi:hypothetical protein